MTCLKNALFLILKHPIVKVKLVLSWGGYFIFCTWLQFVSKEAQEKCMSVLKYVFVYIHRRKFWSYRRQKFCLDTWRKDSGPEKPDMALGSLYCTTAIHQDWIHARRLIWISMLTHWSYTSDFLVQLWILWCLRRWK